MERGLAYLREAYRDGHISGDGPFTRKCEAVLRQSIGADRVLLTTSCSDALEMCALLLDIKPGDEVIVPSFTFVTTAGAFALYGAKPVFADIRPDTFNLDESLLEGAITGRTRAVAVVHYGGTGCEMDEILAVAGRHGAAVIEDNAHGLFGTYRGKPLGSFGQLSTLSFHETKNLSCGEGGAVVINDPRNSGRAEILREKGTDRSRFFRGEVDKYTWVDLGSSFLPSDALAALLRAQIEDRDRIQAVRAGIHRRYSEGLEAWAREQGVGLPVIPPHCGSSHHLFSLLLPTPGSPGRGDPAPAGGGCPQRLYYQPLHLTPMGRQLGGKPGQCPVSESVAGRIVRLPFYFDLTGADQDRVIDAVRYFKA